jgi:two-component system response regulator RegA
MLSSRAFVDEQPSILLVDDDEVFRERLARALRERGWEVRTAGDYTSAMEAARAESPQHALVDLRMPGRSGLELFSRDEREPLAGTADLKAPSLARAEWEHINRVLSDCGGNISEAARRLGMHRRSLQLKLKKYPPRE